MDTIINLLGRILTLDILPHKFGITYNTSITGNHTVWLIGRLISPIINYFITLALNILDFIFKITGWIPYLGYIQNILYYAPDKDQDRYSDAIYNFLYPLIGSSHRNWMTHSVLNPYFLAFVIAAFIIAFIARFIPLVKYIAAFLIIIIGLPFICHLLADTMPQGWGKGSSNNFSNIHFHLLFIKFQMNGFFSKLWLYINALLAGACVEKSAEISVGSES